MAIYSTTPQTTDIYSRYMVNMFDERAVIGVPYGFQAFFARPESGGKTYYLPDSSAVEIDIIRGNERLAALIERGSNGTILGRKETIEEKFSTFARTLPLMEEVGTIHADQLIGRKSGEIPYNGMTRMERMREYAMEIHQEHVRRSVRTCEYLAAASIQDGVMPAIIGTTLSSLKYDFRRKSTQTFTPTTVWTNSAADILGDFDIACGLARENGHVTADMAILGTDAMNAVLADADIRSLADNRGFSMVAIGLNNPVNPKFQKFIDGGFITRGTLQTPGGYNLTLFTYNDGYTASNGTFTPYMPVDRVLVCYSGARVDRYMGPGEVLPMVDSRRQLYREVFGVDPEATVAGDPLAARIGAVVDPSWFSFDAFYSPDYKNLSVRTQLAPIYATTQTDAFVLMDGCA